MSLHSQHRLVKQVKPPRCLLVPGAATVVLTVMATMPIGLWFLIVLGFFISRRARSVERSGLLWICVLWISPLGVSMPVWFSITCWSFIVYGVDLVQKAVRSLHYLPGVLGMSFGAAVAIWRAGRPLAQTPDTSQPRLNLDQP